MKVSSNKLMFFVGLMVFRLIIDLSYVLVISHIFDYEGFSLNFEFGQYLTSWVIYSFSFGMASDRVIKVGHYFFAMALLSVVCPLTSIYGLDAARPLLPVLVTVLSLYLVYFISQLTIFSLRGLPCVAYGKDLAIGMSLVFVVFLIGWFLASGARPNVDFSEVYKFREENSSLVGGGLLAYTNNWTFQVFSIYLISYALYYKRYFYVAALLLIQLYFFSIASHKSILFLPLLVFGSWMYFRYSNSLLVLPIAFCLIIVVSIMSFYLFDDVWLSSLLSRRVFFVPANLCFVYFDFFSHNSQVYWSNSVLSALSAYPYGDLGVPYVIGDYLGRAGMGANNGYVSSGYAHAGLAGVLFYSVLIGLIIRLINDMTVYNMPIWVAVAISVVPLRNILLSSDLFTVMLTHGFGVAMILIYLSRERSSKMTPMVSVRSKC